MGKIFQSGKIIIRVYANDHLPPHFHIVTPDEEALIEIGTMKILAGSLKPSVKKIVFEWIGRNQIVIANEWNRINPRFAIAKGVLDG